jgi:hypothetical protein
VLLITSAPRSTEWSSAHRMLISPPSRDHEDELAEIQPFAKPLQHFDGAFPCGGRLEIRVTVPG